MILDDKTKDGMDQEDFENAALKIMAFFAGKASMLLGEAYGGISMRMKEAGLACESLMTGTEDDDMFIGTALLAEKEENLNLPEEEMMALAILSDAATLLGMLLQKVFRSRLDYMFRAIACLDRELFRASEVEMEYL